MREDFKVRHSHAPVVFTSGRLEGRAPQGFADLLRHYCTSPETPCDAAIEPTANLVQRLLARRSLRQSHGQRAGFGWRWHEQEAHDARLSRQRLFPAELSGELAYATSTIEKLEKAAERQSDNVLVGLGA